MAHQIGGQEKNGGGDALQYNAFRRGRKGVPVGLDRSEAGSIVVGVGVAPTRTTTRTLVPPPSGFAGIRGSSSGALVVGRCWCVSSFLLFLCSCCTLCRDPLLHGPRDELCRGNPSQDTGNGCREEYEADHFVGKVGCSDGPHEDKGRSVRDVRDGRHKDESERGEGANVVEIDKVGAGIGRLVFGDGIDEGIAGFGVLDEQSADAGREWTKVVGGQEETGQECDAAAE